MPLSARKYRLFYSFSGSRPAINFPTSSSVAVNLCLQISINDLARFTFADNSSIKISPRSISLTMRCSSSNASVYVYFSESFILLCPLLLCLLDVVYTTFYYSACHLCANFLASLQCLGVQYRAPQLIRGNAEAALQYAYRVQELDLLFQLPQLMVLILKERLHAGTEAPFLVH